MAEKRRQQPTGRAGAGSQGNERRRTSPAPARSKAATAPRKPGAGPKQGGGKPGGKKEAAGGVRINKVLADAGIASRRSADQMIADGRVSINGKVVTELGCRVSPYDRIMVDGELIGEPERLVYLLLNKPKDTITTTSDERGRRTVLDLVHSEQRIYPVGRLDRHTTGALLLTNDGELANRLMHPRYGVQRYYDVVLDQPLALKDARTIAGGGIDIGDGDITGPCEISVQDKDKTRVAIMLREGKNREVRRLFENFGYEVVRLDRKMYAGLTTRGLARGESRRLDRKEVSALRRMVELEY